MTVSYDVDQRATMREILKVIQVKVGGHVKGEKNRLCVKKTTGAPSNDTEADLAQNLSDLCWNSYDGDVYIATVSTPDSTLTTWVKIVA